MTKRTSKWYGSLANLGVSTAVGSIIKWPSGAIIAPITTSLDEGLIRGGISTKHYLSNTVFWGSVIWPLAEALTTMLPAYLTWPIYTGGAALAGTISYFGDDPLSYGERIDDTLINLGPVIKLFDDENMLSAGEFSKIKNTLLESPYQGAHLLVNDLGKLMSNKFVQCLISAQILDYLKAGTQLFVLNILGANNSAGIVTALVAKDPSISGHDMVWPVIRSIGILSASKLFESCIQSGQLIIDQRFRSAMEQKTMNLLLLDNNTNKIAQIQGGDIATQNLSNDLNTMFFIGKFNFLALTSVPTNLIALSQVMEKIPELLALNKLSADLNTMCDEVAKRFVGKYSEKKTLIESQLAISKADISSKLPLIGMTGSNNITRSKYESNVKHLSQLTQTTTKLEQGQQVGKSLIDIIKEGLSVLVLGYKVLFDKTLSIEQILPLQNFLSQSETLLKSKNPCILLDAAVKQKRVLNLLETINKPLKTTVVREFNDENKLIIDGYTLKLDNAPLLTIPHLEFPDHCSAISGFSGIGKTSLFKDIMGYLMHPLTSTGKFSLPDMSGSITKKTMLVDQHLYIPSGLTLLEAITLTLAERLEGKDEVKSRIIELFKKCQVDQSALSGQEDSGLISKLEDPKFNCDDLSGGQKKKIGIVRAIITQPDVLLADEIFVGLDPKSIYLVQKLLSEYLPNTKIIVIDHYADNNNYDGFYERCIEFTGQTGYKEIPLTSKTPLTIHDIEVPLTGFEPSYNSSCL